MSPAASRDSYRRMVDQIVTFRRYTGTGPNRPRFDTDVRARVVGYAPDELVGGILQGDRKVILLAEDLVAAQVRPPSKGDKIVIRGAEANIEFVNDSTRRVGGELMAYELVVRGG